MRQSAKYPAECDEDGKSRYGIKRLTPGANDYLNRFRLLTVDELSAYSTRAV